MPLDVVVAATNLTGAPVANLADDPDAPDGLWATATSVADTALRAGFPAPSGPLLAGNGVQEFRVLLRKNATGGTAPTYDLELWETGGAARLALLAGGVSLSSDAPTVVSAIWDASLLGTPDGSKVEVRVVGHLSGGSPSNRRTVEVGAAEWNAATNTPGTTGFYYLRARYYDAGTGRFLSRDAWPASPRHPQSLHRYEYVHNNPVNFVDPSGLHCKGLLHIVSHPGHCFQDNRSQIDKLNDCARAEREAQYPLCTASYDLMIDPFTDGPIVFWYDAHPATRCGQYKACVEQGGMNCRPFDRPLKNPVDPTDPGPRPGPNFRLIDGHEKEQIRNSSEMPPPDW